MEDCIKDWHEVYIEGGYDDPHAEFSARTSQSRSEAKVMCYKIAYSIKSSDVMKAFLQ